MGPDIPASACRFPIGYSIERSDRAYWCGYFGDDHPDPVPLTPYRLGFVMENNQANATKLRGQKAHGLSLVLALIYIAPRQFFRGLTP